MPPQKLVSKGAVAIDGPSVARKNEKLGKIFGELSTTEQRDPSADVEQWPLLIHHLFAEEICHGV